MVLVFLEWLEEHEDVFQVGETEVESTQNAVHETEHLGGIAHVEGHEGVLE